MFFQDKKLMFVYKAGLLLMGTALFVYVFYQSSQIFLSALIGLGLAAIINPVITYIDRNSRIPRFASALLLLFFVGLLFMVLFYFVGSIMFEQLDSLKENYPQIINKWEKRWDRFSEAYPRITRAITETQPMGIAQTTVGYIGIALTSLTGAATGLTLAAVISLFTAANSKRYFRGLVEVFPKSKQKRIAQDLILCSKTLRKWFVAQFTDMCAVAVLTTIGLWIAGVDYWALYGVLAGVLSIVPYVGILVVVALSGAIVAVLQPDKLLWLIVVFVVTQQLEGNFILPKVMKDQVRIPAAPLIFFMILAGHWFGVLGVFVTPPLMAIGVALYNKDEIKELPQ